MEPTVLARALLLALVAPLASAGACHGGGPSRTTTPRAAAGPADIPAMRALLARYSPTGHHIVTTYESLPTRFVFGGRAVTLTHIGEFADFFHDGSPEKLVDQMATSVHEVYHGYGMLMGHQLLAESGAQHPVDVEAVHVGETPILVTYTASYPAREMDATFPADARTSRYAVYVSPSQTGYATQRDGAYALLDELAAYYHSARTHVDLWPWVRDEAPASEQLILGYVARFHELWVPYAEFKLYLLHYLLHAREHHPDVYQGLVGNEGFRRAFAACDDAYAALLATAAALEPTIHAFARSRGVNAGLQDGLLVIDGAPFNIRDAAYPAVLRRLASAEYQAILAELR